MGNSRFFREKPKEVEARLFDGDTAALMDVVAWAQAQGYVWFEPFTPAPAKGITTYPDTGFLGVASDGVLKIAEKGDWLYVDVDGNIKTKKGPEFEATYEEVSPPDPPAAP